MPFRPLITLWEALTKQLLGLMVHLETTCVQPALTWGIKLFLGQRSGSPDASWLPVFPSVFTSNPLCIRGFKLTWVSDLLHQRQCPVLSPFLCVASFRVHQSQEQGLGCLLPAVFPRDGSI